MRELCASLCASYAPTMRGAICDLGDAFGMKFDGRYYARTMRARGLLCAYYARTMREEFLSMRLVVLLYAARVFLCAYYARTMREDFFSMHLVVLLCAARVFLCAYYARAMRDER